MKEGTQMSYPGHVKNGVVIFDESISLPDGTEVRVEPVAPMISTFIFYPVLVFVFSKLYVVAPYTPNGSMSLHKLENCTMLTGHGNSRTLKPA